VAPVLAPSVYTSQPAHDKGDGEEGATLTWAPGPVEDEPDGSNLNDLIFLVERQRDLVAAVATGKSITPYLDSEYKGRRRKIRAGLQRLGIDDPFPWPDLYQWWGFCSAPRMTKYSERRAYVAEISEPVLDELERRRSGLVDWAGGGGPETWATLQGRLDGLRDELNRAATHDDLQDVGRRAREIIIDAANMVFDDSMVPANEPVPSPNDAKRRIDFYLNHRVPGQSQADLRRVVRTVLDLANTVTHSDSITRVDAYATAQATIFIVRTLQEMSA
jgi:hypothetical protein